MKKKTKFSLGMKIVTLLTVITMASVGFAAWVITAPVTDAKADGTIDVEQVYDESVTVEAKWVKRNSANNGFEELGEGIKPAIKYGMPSPAPATTYNWLTNTNNEFNENLDVYLKVTVTNKSSQKNAELNLQFEASDLSKFNGAIDVSGTNKYISAPTFTRVKEVDAQKFDESTIVHSYSNAESAENKFEIGTTNKKDNVNAPEKETTYYIKVSFDWGAEVGGENAYTFYNGSAYDEELAGKANDYLSGLYDALQGITYTITLSIDLV